MPEWFATTMELSAEEHIRVQAAIQRWVDSSISKTANCPADFTVEEKARLYELAFELGCKGVTIYRDGSRDTQVLSTTKKDGDAASTSSDMEEDAHVGDGREGTAGQPKLPPDGIFAAASEARVQQVGLPGTGAVNDKIINKEYKKRPQVLRGATYKIHSPFGMAYITINDMGGTPGEIFLRERVAD